ncbi:MAG: tetratricopeptide repeat protein, partial [Planctomycetota bacterium]
MGARASSLSGLLLILVGAAAAPAQEPPLGFDPLGRALAEAGAALEIDDAQAALAAAERAIELAPRSAEARLVWLRALNGAGRFEVALEHFGAEPAEPFGPAVTLELGQAARGLGRFDEAERAFEQVLTDYPASGPARAALVDLRLSRGDDAGAWEALGPLRIQAPDLAWGVAAEARLLARGGDLDTARALLADQLELDDDVGSVRFALIELSLAGAPARALALASEWFDAPPTEDARLLAGRAALAAGDDLAALEVALTGLRKRPGSTAALELANAALGKQGRVAERLLERRLALA